MFKKTIIAGSVAMVAGSLSGQALAAEYKGPDLKGETLSITCPWTGPEESYFKKVGWVSNAGRWVSISGAPGAPCSTSAEASPAYHARMT